MTDTPAAANQWLEYRVACADGSDGGFTLSDYADAVYCRESRDGLHDHLWRIPNLHAECGPHRIESRSVTYGDWEPPPAATSHSE